MQFYVKDIMSTDLITIKENASIRDAIKILSNNDISGLPVQDYDSILVGVVSARDIIENESSHSFYTYPFRNDIELKCLEDSKFFDNPVSTIMSKDLFTIEPDDTVAKMAKVMYEKKIHRLLVAEYDKLIGIVTTFDVLKLLATSDESVVI
jgi:CBS domain-containing protein